MNDIVYNPEQMARFLAFAIPAHYPVLIKGKPGIGKTDIVFQAAEATGYKVLLTHPVVADPTDYKGLPFAINGEDGQEAMFLPFGDLKKMIYATEPMLVFIDDMGQAHESVQKAIMQLILARCIGEHKVSDFVTFVAATNRRIDKAGVIGFLEPVKSRFITIVELVTDLECWIRWALSHKVSTEMISFIRFRPGFLDDFKPTNDLINSPCPRTVVNCDKLYQLGLDSDLEYVAYAGAAGDEFAAEFTGFLKIFRTLPNPDVILMNPSAGDIPTDPATLYALCGALARKASDQNIDRLVTYYNRLPAEFSVLAMRDTVQNCPDVQSSRAFIEWTTAHQDVLL